MQSARHLLFKVESDIDHIARPPSQISLSA